MQKYFSRQIRQSPFSTKYICLKHREGVGLILDLPAPLAPRMSWPRAAAANREINETAVWSWFPKFCDLANWLLLGSVGQPCFDNVVLEFMSCGRAARVPYPWQWVAKNCRMPLKFIGSYDLTMNDVSKLVQGIRSLSKLETECSSSVKIRNWYVLKWCYTS